MPIIKRAFAAGVIVCACVMTACLARADAGAPFGNPFLVKSWSTEEGLPQSSVIALIQTHDGYLWMGTLNGLVRFDGEHFAVYDESNTPGLTSSRIVHLFEDSRTNLWVGTETAGVLLIRGGQAIPLDLGRGSRESRLLSATEDEHGTVWLYTADGQLCRYLNGRKKVWDVGADPFSLSRNVIAEKGGFVWAGTDSRLYGIGEAHTNNLDRFPVTEELPVDELDFLLASRTGGYWRLANGHIQKWEGKRMLKDYGGYAWGDPQITAACEDDDGGLIIGTSQSGVYWLDLEGQTQRIEGLSSDYILSLCLDHEGTLWIGTDGGGLNRVKRSRFTTLPGTENWVVQSTAADAKGGLWIGSNGGELAYWTGTELKSYRTTREPVPPSIKSVAVDDDGQVWVGTWGRGLFTLKGDDFQQIFSASLVNAAITTIHQDRKGTLWLGTPIGLLGKRLFTTQHGLTHNVVQALADDADGNLWIGTGGGGLNRLRNGKFMAWTKAVSPLPSDEINAIHPDEDGVLWIATGGGGLVRLHEGKWFTFSKQDGLPSNSIGYLLEDAKGFLWLGSNSGLLRVAKTALNAYALGKTNSLSIRSYGRADGLKSGECTFGSQPAAAATPDGRLWFPTIQGLVTVDPSELAPNPVPPPVVIESIRIDEEEQNTNSLGSSWPARVTLVPGNQLLEISYTSLNLGARDRARFRYRLEGHDPTWISAKRDQVARYTQLPPGDYTFRVTAANEDGLWNQSGAAFGVSVLPPFYRTWLFLLITTVLLVGLIAASVYYISTQRLQQQVAMLRQKEALEKERARIARDLHDQLGANLTQVTLLGELAEADKDLPDEVEDHAQQICQTARETTHALDEIVWAANPSNDTLEGLVNYVCKYAQEYLALAKLRYRLDVPSPLPKVTLQPELRHNVFLAAKEAVNNVVKHAQASEARLSLKLDESSFTLEIADNGRGPGGTETKAAKSRNGMRNMRKRMSDVGGRFLIDPAPGGGSIVRLNVPLKKD